MVVDIKYNISGLREINDALVKMPNRLGKRAMNKALTRGAKLLVGEIRRWVPVRTGNLKRSIAYKVVGRSNQPMVQVGPRVAGGRGKNKRPKNDGFYAKFLEFGTKKMSARPFMRPAFDSSQERLLSEIGQAMAAEVAVAAGKFVS